MRLLCAIPPMMSLSTLLAQQVNNGTINTLCEINLRSLNISAMFDKFRAKITIDRTVFYKYMHENELFNMKVIRHIKNDLIENTLEFEWIYLFRTTLFVDRNN